MAFVKNGSINGKEPKVGDWVKTTVKHESFAGYFEVGSEVQIIGYGPRGYDIRDAEGNTMIECGWKI